MREANRIERIMAKVGMLWLENPDFCFGLLISNLYSRIKYSDMLYAEDDEIEEFLDKVLESYQNVVPMEREEIHEKREV